MERAHSYCQDPEPGTAKDAKIAKGLASEFVRSLHLECRELAHAFSSDSTDSGSLLRFMPEAG
ncbi:MAG: hypothetical protein U0V70_03200 [Terriglobia bacterium]